MKFYKKYKQTKELDRKLASLSAPETPESVSKAWFNIPANQHTRTPGNSSIIRWAASSIVMAFAAFLYSKGSAETLAKAVKDASTPPQTDMITQNAWLQDISRSWPIMLLVLMAIAAYGIAVFLSFKERKKSRSYSSLKFVISVPAVLVLWALLLALVMNYAIVKLILALIMPGLFLGFVFANFSSILMRQSALHTFGSYLRHFGKLIFLIISTWGMYGFFVIPFVENMPRIIWLPGVLIGWLTSPIFIRRYFHADDEC